MPKITLNKTIQYKRKTYRRGETVEIPVESVDSLQEFGTIFMEERQSSTKRNKKKADS